MAILVKPPLSVRVTDQGITNILPNDLPPGFRYRIYVIDLSVTKGKDPITLLESGTKRWTGLVEQKKNWRLDFGKEAWTLAEGSTLDIEIKKKTELDVNILQYAIVWMGNNNG